MEEPISPSVKVDRPAEAETVLPDGDDDDDDADKPETAPVTPPKPTPPAEDLQLKKAIEVVKQATVGQTKRVATLRHPARVVGDREIRLAA